MPLPLAILTLELSVGIVALVTPAIEPTNWPFTDVQRAVLCQDTNSVGRSRAGGVRFGSGGGIQS